MSSVFVILFSDGVDAYPLTHGYPTLAAAKAARARHVAVERFNPADLTIHEILIQP